MTCIMIDRFGVIRDYLYERDENGEYFFGDFQGQQTRNLSADFGRGFVRIPC